MQAVIVYVRVDTCQYASYVQDILQVHRSDSVVWALLHEVDVRVDTCQYASYVQDILQVHLSDSVVWALLHEGEIIQEYPCGRHAIFTPHNHWPWLLCWLATFTPTTFAPGIIGLLVIPSHLMISWDHSLTTPVRTIPCITSSLLWDGWRSTGDNSHYFILHMARTN